MNLTNQVALEAQLRLLSTQYAFAVDDRDTDRLTQVFHPDASIEVHDGPFPTGTPRHTVRGHHQIRTIISALTAYTRTFHMFGQASYEIRQTTAEGRIYCVANHLTSADDTAKNEIMHIRYDDTYSDRREHGWRIDRRLVNIRWTEMHNVDQKPANRGRQ